MKRLALLLAFVVIPVARTQDLPEGEGKQLVERLCVGCHSLEVVTSQRATKRGWASILDNMGTLGMDGSSDEIQTMLEYLTKNFAKVPARINVNKATAKEIEMTLELTTKEAEAIVKYRQDHGDYKDWPSFSKAAEVDPKKLEGKKDLVTFN